MLFRFGSFTVDSLQRQVFARNFVIHLNPKVFDTLLYLVENPGRIVTKPELLDGVWQGTNVSESNLTQTVFLLRNALKTHDPRPYLVTVPGQGYQFAVEVTQSPPDNSSARENLWAGHDLEKHASPVYDWLSNRTTQSLQKAILWCERRIRANPFDGPAFADLANAYCLAMGLGEIAPKQALPKIQNAVFRALEGIPPAHSAFAPLGFLRCHFDRDWLTAERDFQRALDECPADLMAHHWYGEFLAAWQRFDESLNLLRRAQTRDPQSLLIQTDIAMILYWAGEYKDCEAELLKARSRNTTFPRTNIVLGSTYARQAQYGKAIRTLEGVTSAGSNVIGLTVLAETCGVAGEIRGVKKAWNAMQSLAPSRYISCYAKALTCKNLGETDRFLEFLEQAEEENDYWLLWQRVAPYFADFRREPRFQRVLRRMKLA